MQTEPIHNDPTSSRACRFLLWILLASVLFAGLWAGVAWRGWWFRMTTPVHFGDIARNWTWGAYTYYNIHDKGRSFLDTYDDVGIQSRGNQLWIDYAPARLLINTLWVASNHRDLPYEWHRSWRNKATPQQIYEFHAFYRIFNTCMEFAASVAAFLLIWDVTRRAGSRETRAAILSAIGALLLWFNPAMILSAHGWPSGDMWIIPPFLWAVYFCRIERWFLAGVVLAIGALFKGQQFFVIAVLILWPLFQMRWKPPLRLLGGFAATFGLLTTGWTLTYIDPAGFRHLSIAAMLLTITPLLLATIYFVLRWKLPNIRLPHIRQSTLIPIALGLAGAAAFSSMWIFDTCYAWFDASYAFGTDHWVYMIMGKTSNLPGIMLERYGWDLERGPVTVLFTLFRSEITLKTFLFSIFICLLVVTAAGIAMHDKRNSTRFLAAIVTPWLLFFTIPCQIHERYLLFAACVACVCVGHSIGATLLGIFCTILTWLMTLHIMLIAGNRNGLEELLHKNYPTLFTGDGFVNRLFSFIGGTHPDVGWAVILTTLIFLWITITPLRRDKAIQS